jgi:hypothetical protein
MVLPYPAAGIFAMSTLTLQKILQVYGQQTVDRKSVKLRDPIERELLIRTGDRQVLREDPSRKKRAGERPRP